MAENPLATDLEHILDHTRDLWEELRGGRIFITGGTGFFGCWLLESLAWANDRLGLNASALVLTRNLEAFRKKAPHLASDPSIQFQIGDVRSFEFPTGRFSHVIHAATEPSDPWKAEAALLISLVVGTGHTLDFAGECKAQKLLLASSGAVYGKPPPEMTHIPEDYPGAPDPTDARSAFGEGKRAAELLCSLYARHWGFEAKIARGFAFVGPYLPLDTHYAIGNFIRDGLHGGPIVVEGDGTPLRSYLYAADLAIWLWTILFKGESLRPYNVGSEESLSIAQVAERVADLIPGNIAVQIRGTPNPLKPPERYVPDIERAKSELGLQAWVGLSDGIRRSLKTFPSG